MNRLSLALLACLLACLLTGCPRPGAHVKAPGEAATVPVRERLEIRADLPRKAAGPPVEVAAVLGRTDRRADLDAWEAIARGLLDLRDRAGDAAVLRTAWEFMDTLAGVDTPGAAAIRQAYPATVDKLRYLLVAQSLLAEPMASSAAAPPAADDRQLACDTIRAFCLASMNAGKHSELKLNQMAGVSLTLVREARPVEPAPMPVPVREAKPDAPNPADREGQGWSWGSW